MFNLILSGDIEDNIMARFYIRDGQTEKAEWCSISLISVLYDDKIPMYVVGTVRDLSSKLKVVMETSMNSRGKVPKVFYPDLPSSSDTSAGQKNLCSAGL